MVSAAASAVGPLEMFIVIASELPDICTPERYPVGEITL